MYLRPMVMSDAEKMLEWKNYPETRQFAIQSHDEIKLEDHLKWLEKNIQHFQIIELVEERVGAIRILNGEISIWIDRKWWGKGVATIALKRISESGMFAKIVNGNIGSFKAFIRAGFEPFTYVNSHYDYKDYHYILQKP